MTTRQPVETGLPRQTYQQQEGALVREWGWSREGKGDSRLMDQHGIDRLTRAMARCRSRRQALAALCGAGFGLGAGRELGAKRRRDRRRDGAKGADKRDATKSLSKKKSSSNKNAAFSRDCHRFVIAGGSDRDDKFQHIDDDLRIELIPKGKKSDSKVLLDDDNNSPNGRDGDHIKVMPFTARLGDKIRIIARNEVAGGCEVDEIWLHCIEGQGGKIKLNNRILPGQCQGSRVGVFLDKTVRIRNK